MTAYLLTFRAPAGYTGTPETFDAWCAWQARLGARLKDRGYRAVAAAALGADPAATQLGGYSLIRAASLDQALELARDCPLLAHGGTVEVGELDGRDDAFDQWLAEYLGQGGSR
jgi:hypothetical protein